MTASSTGRCPAKSEFFEDCPPFRWFQHAGEGCGLTQGVHTLTFLAEQVHDLRERAVEDFAPYIPIRLRASTGQRPPVEIRARDVEERRVRKQFLSDGPMKRQTAAVDPQMPTKR